MQQKCTVILNEKIIGQWKLLFRCLQGNSNSSFFLSFRSIECRYKLYSFLHARFAYMCVCCSRDERHLFGDEPLLFTFVNFSLCIHSSCCFFWGAYFPPTLVNNSTENNAHYGHKKETIILCVACLFSLAKRRIWVNRAHTVRAFSFSQFAEK